MIFSDQFPFELVNRAGIALEDSPLDSVEHRAPVYLRGKVVHPILLDGILDFPQRTLVMSASRNDDRAEFSLSESGGAPIDTPIYLPEHDPGFETRYSGAGFVALHGVMTLEHQGSTFELLGRNQDNSLTPIDDLPHAAVWELVQRISHGILNTTRQS